MKQFRISKWNCSVQEDWNNLNYPNESARPKKKELWWQHKKANCDDMIFKHKNISLHTPKPDEHEELELKKEKLKSSARYKNRDSPLKWSADIL